MKDKYSETDDFYLDENSVPVRANSSLKQDNELFDDSSYIPQNLINVKRIVLPSKDEDWEVYDKGTCSFVLKGVRFTKKERIFLRTPEGFRFIIDGYKKGWKSVSEFKKQIKKNDYFKRNKK